MPEVQEPVLERAPQEKAEGLARSIVALGGVGRNCMEGAVLAWATRFIGRLVGALRAYRPPAVREASDELKVLSQLERRVGLRHRELRSIGDNADVRFA